MKNYRVWLKVIEHEVYGDEGTTKTVYEDVEANNLVEAQSEVLSNIKDYDNEVEILNVEILD